jgi:hypothetical protein
VQRTLHKNSGEILRSAKNEFSDTVGKYHANTGKAINASFITGLSVPFGLVLKGNTLFVVAPGEDISLGVGTVGKYDATTGAVIKADFISGLFFPQGIAVKSANQ